MRPVQPSPEDVQLIEELNSELCRLAELDGNGKERIPPLQAYKHVFQQLISKQSVFEQHIPFILDVLANVEIYRSYSVDLCRDALSRCGDSPEAITTEQINKLKTLEEGAFEIRKIYINLIFDICTYDMFRLAAFSATDILIHFFEYFNVSEDLESRRLFHHDLMEEEKKTCREIGRYCAGLCLEPNTERFDPNAGFKKILKVSGYYIRQCDGLIEDMKSVLGR